MEAFIDLSARTGRAEPKHYKATLVRSQRLMLGLNCLEPGQVQPVHSHEGQDKFYYVVEGEGRFTVDNDVRKARSGTLIWAPAGVDHGVENVGSRRLTLFMGMAPPPP